MYQAVGETVLTVYNTSGVSKQWYENKYLVCFFLFKRSRVHAQVIGRYCD